MWCVAKIQLYITNNSFGINSSNEADISIEAESGSGLDVKFYGWMNKSPTLIRSEYHHHYQQCGTSA